MIHSIKIRNFQSLADVALELGPFTVIVGPSSSGKSAFIRATRTLTSNRRGAEFISHGERTAVISAVTDRGTVTLTRSKGSTDNTYRVIPADPGHPLAPERTFEKLGGETPAEVSDFLGIEARDPLNYAGQFDMPFLLGPSQSAEAARTLGSLTNVNLIFEGARESNRQKQQSAQQLRVRAEDLAAIKEKIPAYRSLKAQQLALDKADEHLAAARDLERRAARLSAAAETISAAAVALESLQERAERDIPSDAGIVDAARSLTRLTEALRSVATCRRTLEQSQSVLEATTERLTEAEADYAEVLGDLGDSLAGWFLAIADPTKQEVLNGATYVEVPEAIRVFTMYLETTATND